ncbi:MAG: hydrogen gas-evolving membrane-bound hydrogenase subunit E [Pseudomonadota bacterium]
MGSSDTADARALSVAGLLPCAISLALFLWLSGFIPEIAAGETVRYATPWVPSLGVALSFVLDGLGLTFALLITGIGFLVMLYSAKYLAGHIHHTRFSVYLTAFMLSMLGLVLADNLILLFVFWELTTVTSFLLIGFSHNNPDSRRSALQAMLVTAGGGLSMLPGLLLIGSVAGTYELSEIRAMGGILRDSTYYLPILILILCGAFTKSAQVPFHFWLPNAMAAPTPVSAYLHSATMVKGGVYLLARMHPSLSGTDVWMWTLAIFGAVTAVFASVLSLRQTDLKLALAYTTLMALGTLVMFLSASNAYAITAMATFLVVHSFYKAALFLAVGCIDHQTGTRDARILGGLWRKMPITALAAGLAALSMAGVPPFLGFIAKEFLYKGALEAPTMLLLVGAAFAASAMMFAVAGIVAFKPFYGSGKAMDPDKPVDGEAPWFMFFGPLVLGVAGIAFGLAPHVIESISIAPTVGSLLGDLSQAKHLHLWAGVNTALILSLLTFATGFVIYALHLRIRAGLEKLAETTPDSDVLWDKLLASSEAGMTRFTNFIQNGVLKRYLTTVFGTLAIFLAISLILGRPNLAEVSFPNVELKHWSIFVLTIMGVALVLATRSRIVAIASLGVVGIGVALIFIMFGAPDVAITQLLVETLAVVLFALASLRLPGLPKRDEVPRRWGDLVFACFVGGMIMIVLLADTAGSFNLALTQYFETASYPDAYGRNIVNVILVDFRAVDTFGEISVVAIAALSAVALLRQRIRVRGSRS